MVGSFASVNQPKTHNPKAQPVQPIIYNHKTFIITSPVAARLMLDAKEMRKTNIDRASGLVALAVKVETGTMDASEALALANPLCNAA